MGCYHYDMDDDGIGPLFPLTLSPDLPCYLVRGKRNLRDEVMSELGWDDRLERHGLRQRIANTNFLPHGGGYRYEQFTKVAKVHESAENRVFELQSADSAIENQRIDTPRGLPYTYRGMEVKERMSDLDLGQAVVKLDLRYVLGR